MPGISIHVVDISRGIVASGMGAELLIVSGGEKSKPLVSGFINESGALAGSGLSRVCAAGLYRAVFHVGDYYRKCGIVSGDHPFLDIVNYDFGISDPEQHVHLPFKCTPWGYSCFRGGA